MELLKGSSTDTGPAGVIEFGRRLVLASVLELREAFDVRDFQGSHGDN